jgi:hypothetical protein
MPATRRLCDAWDYLIGTERQLALRYSRQTRSVYPPVDGLSASRTGLQNAFAPDYFCEVPLRQLTVTSRTDGLPNAAFPTRIRNEKRAWVRESAIHLAVSSIWRSADGPERGWNALWSRESDAALILAPMADQGVHPTIYTGFPGWGKVSGIWGMPCEDCFKNRPGYR